jgi:hypothetical protein
MNKQITIQDRFAVAATLENALNWAADSEKFTYCIDLLEISARRQNSDRWVNRLEDHFETLIKKEADACTQKIREKIHLEMQRVFDKRNEEK